MTAKTSDRHASSFRDPSGFVFTSDGKLYRQVNQHYKDDYDQLLSSGLYVRLTEKQMLVLHREVSISSPENQFAYKVIEPDLIPFINYPFEWCFSQLKDAALLTLTVLLEALDAGMILKDASCYNVQFCKGKPILIDTLSFEVYREGEPWIGYRQFCQHFLAPLALMVHKDVRLAKLLAVHIDGIPLDLASSVLPAKTWLDYRLLTHIHLHSRCQTQANGQGSKDAKQNQLPLTSLKALIDDLRSAISNLKLSSLDSTWVSYEKNNNYEQVSVEAKKKLVGEYLQNTNARVVLDLGANTGEYSRLASTLAELVVSADFDHNSVETNYRRCVESCNSKMLPLVIDLNNPSPAIGFANSERSSFIERGKSDAVMALALVHHLAIANNVPLNMIAQLFAELGKYLIIEFVPKEDSQVQILLSSRKDIFADYTQDGFEKAFLPYFAIEQVAKIGSSSRSLYLMKALIS